MDQDNRPILSSKMLLGIKSMVAPSSVYNVRLLNLIEELSPELARSCLSSSFQSHKLCHMVSTSTTGEMRNDCSNHQ